MLGIKISYPVSTFTRTLLPLADAAAHRTALAAQQLAPYLTSLSGLGTATGLVRKGAGNSASVQPTSLVVDTFLGAASKEEARTTLGLVPGTDIQPYNAELAAIAALTTTTFGRSLLTQNDAATARTTLGAAATSHTQDWSTITNSPTNLSGYGITDAQPLNSDLTALAGLTTTGLVDRTGPGTAATRATGATGLAVLASADASAARTAIGAMANTAPEIITNANGTAYRWPNGLQICTYNGFQQNATQAVGSIFQHTTGSSWTFPAEFNTEPACFGSSKLGTNTWIGFNVGGATAASVRMLSAASVSATGSMRVVAVGTYTP